MISIIDKHNCCSCGACVQRCPKQCIHLHEDTEGFLYPQIDLDICVECGLCEKVCPIINVGVATKPLHTYAAINKDEDIRAQSSSGGVFTLLAESIISNGGVVFGAAFNDKWEVVHTYTENLEGLEALRRSKYVQSKIGDTYLQAESFLKVGRQVMYVGTPCQIAGLKRFLRVDYANLVAVDFICHGVPSPKVWRMYLDEIIRTKCGVGKNSVPLSLNDISDISFRDKANGWKKFGFKVWLKSAFKADQNTVSKFGVGLDERSVLLDEPFVKNQYMRLFLSDVILRPSCYNCSAKSGRSGSDITIADYWGIDRLLPEFDDDRGVSLIIAKNSSDMLGELLSKTTYREMCYDSVLRHNPSVEKSCSPHSKRSMFFAQLDGIPSLSELIDQTLKRSLYRRVRSFIKRVIMKFIEV